MDVVLFDIDGTLVDTGGAGRRAIERAAGELYGRPDLFEGIAFDGATDFSICRRALERLGSPPEDGHIRSLLSVYLEHLEQEMAQAPVYRVYPGVSRLIEELQRRRVLIGLGTGNVERGARLKLARGGLNGFFPFGGFGDDAEERSGILQAGLRRAEALLGRSPERAWIIGDTPRDLEAARAVGARCLLVATGKYSVESLRAHAPDLCFETLEPVGTAEAMGSLT